MGAAVVCRSKCIEVFFSSQHNASKVRLPKVVMGFICIFPGSSACRSELLRNTADNAPIISACSMHRLWVRSPRTCVALIRTSHQTSALLPLSLHLIGLVRRPPFRVIRFLEFTWTWCFDHRCSYLALTGINHARRV